MTQAITQNQPFQTFDLGCVAALLCENFKLLKLDRSNPKKVSFCFEYEDGLEEAVENYFSGDFQVDAQTYWNSIKSLKNRIYSS